MNRDEAERYLRQLAFSGIGQKGQDRLKKASAAIVGMGALGSAIANSLCRAGFGFLRLIDADVVEASNLQRQILYNEEDARLKRKKAVCAKEKLASINSLVRLEAITEKLDAQNADELLSGVDMVLDGLDNFDTRFVINEYCVKNAVPYIYGGVLADSGVSMNIMPGGPCLGCIVSSMVDAKSGPGPETKGVLNQIVAIIAAIQSVEAMKLAVKSRFLRRSLLSFSIWDFSFTEIEVEPRKDCFCQKSADFRNQKF
ncbi:hypothetical protein MASR2M29_15130 [Spirochaetota bacterium]